MVNGCGKLIAAMMEARGPSWHVATHVVAVSMVDVVWGDVMLWRCGNHLVLRRLGDAAVVAVQVVVASAMDI